MARSTHTHKPDCPCPTCNPSARLSENERTVVYTIKVPESLKKRLKGLGSARVREILSQHA